VIVGKAVSEHVGVAEFHVFEKNDAISTLSAKWVDVVTDTSRLGESKTIRERYEVETMTLDDALRAYGPADYVKIDVEGHEVAVIRGLSHAPPLLSFEANLPEFRSETIECVDHLSRIAPTMVFNYDYRFELEMPEWVSAAEAKRWLETTALPYAEVWGRLRREA
jgi:hypothetical protein